MKRTLRFLATIIIVASAGQAAESHALAARARQDGTPNGRQPASTEVTVPPSFQPPASTAASISRGATSQATGARPQAAAIDEADLALDGQTGGSGPHTAKRADSAGGETQAARDSSASQTTSTRNPAVQNISVEPVTASGQLPQTSTILPLLGLIGLGSLVAGFFARR